MNNAHKVIIGLALAIAVLGGIYVNRPKIEVTAEAAAYATSTIIVPTSTVSHETSVATTTPDVAPQTINIYKTYVESNGETKEETKPTVIEPITVDPITYVPTPVYSSPQTTAVQPVTAGSMIEIVETPTPAPTPAPVPEPTPEPIIEAPFYSEYPHYWVEERNNGRWIFFQATWSDGSKGKIVCNGMTQDNNVVSGLPSIVEEKNLADQITGGSLIAEGRYVSCTFTVGSHGGVTANITVR